MEGTPLIAVLRALHVATMLSLLGVQAFMTWLLPDAPGTLRRSLRRIALGSAALTLLAGVAWLVQEAAVIADAGTLPALRVALPVVLVHTRFGQIVTVSLLLLALSAILTAILRQGLTIALLLTAASASLQGLVGHAGAAKGWGLLVSEALHLLAAGLWLGALLPLWLSIRALPSGPAARLCERFTPLGLGCVLVLAGTGFAQGYGLIGSVHALVASAYGRIAILKITLFLFALVLAAGNRLWLTDRLAGELPHAKGHLLASLVIETATGLAIVTAAAFLASTMPGIDRHASVPMPGRAVLVQAAEPPQPEILF